MDKDNQVSVAISINICKLIQNGDIDGLKKLGLNAKIIDQIKNLSLIEMPVLIRAINKTTVNYQIDAMALSRTIESIKAINNRKNFIDSLVLCGASYVLIRNFYYVYTNREHSRLRKKLDNPIVLFDGNHVDEYDLSTYFYKIENKINPKRKVSIQDLYQYHKDHKVSINTVWKFYSLYEKNKRVTDERIYL